STRICPSVASILSPSHRAWMTEEPRILSEPASQIVRRTTSRASRSIPQWELSMCMSGLAIKGCIGVGFASSRVKSNLVKDRQSRSWGEGRATNERKCSFPPLPMVLEARGLLYDYEHLMGL